jgi:hypothetical protein
MRVDSSLTAPGEGTATKVSFDTQTDPRSGKTAVGRLAIA